MYEYLSGSFVHKAPTHVVVDVQGVGYFVHISLNTFTEIKDEVAGTLYISFQVREDAHTLYGFSTEQERQLFENLISVSGIGPGTGRMILSALTVEEAQSAIVTGNVAVLKSVKGIGPKTAQRMILELQDKLSKLSGGIAGSAGLGINLALDEAGSALVLLGFAKNQVDKCLGQIAKESPGLNVEGLIKEALKRL